MFVKLPAFEFNIFSSWSLTLTKSIEAYYVFTNKTLL